MQILNVFASTSENGVLIFISKNDFENFKKLQGLANILVFLIKISCQSKESALSKWSAFSLTPPFLEKKIFHPHS